MLNLLCHQCRSLTVYGGAADACWCAASYQQAGCPNSRTYCRWRAWRGRSWRSYYLLLQWHHSTTAASTASIAWTTTTSTGPITPTRPSPAPYVPTRNEPAPILPWRCTMSELWQTTVSLPMMLHSSAAFCVRSHPMRCKIDEFEC